MGKRKQRRMRTNGGKIELVAADVENPHYSRDHAESRSNPRKIRVMKNARESAVETLFARGGLDLAQKQAADRFRMIWERCGGSGSVAMDYGREIVDGGGARDPISERQVEAGKELARCRNLLGARLYALVCRVCGEGLSLPQIATMTRERLTAADNLRGALDDLAGMWGIISRLANG